MKPVEYLRIGLAFHSPTVYRISERYYDNISSNFEGNDHYEFKNEPLDYKYTLTTPFRVMTGVAVQIKKLALISAEYEFVDYSTARFSEAGDGYDYSSKNLDIKEILRSTGNLRLGGEVRMNNIYFRGGYGYYGKVFKEGEDNENMDYSSVSFGIGYREQNLSVDFGYTNMQNPQKYIMYNTYDDTVFANLTTGRNIFTVTVGYKFGY